MINFNIKISENLKYLLKNKKKDKIKKWIQKATIYLNNQVKKNTPVDTWVLRAGNMYRIEESKSLFWVVYNNVDYAVYVHFWTKKTKANPFLLWTAEKERGKIKNIILKEISK